MAIDSTGKAQAAYRTVISKGGLPVLFRRPVYTGSIKTGAVDFYGVAIESEAKEPVTSNVQGLMVELLVPAVETDAQGVATGEVLELREEYEVEYLGRRAVVVDTGRVAPAGEQIIYTPTIKISRDPA